MSVMMLVFWGGLIALVVWALRVTRGPAQTSEPPAPTAHELLAQRFARGEIDDEEFDRRRRALDAATHAVAIAKHRDER